MHIDPDSIFGLIRRDVENIGMLAPPSVPEKEISIVAETFRVHCPDIVEGLHQLFHEELVKHFEVNPVVAPVYHGLMLTEMLLRAVITRAHPEFNWLSDVTFIFHGSAETTRAVQQSIMRHAEWCRIVARSN